MPKHALIVDPNRERFHTYRSIFRDEGMAVEWAHNGLHACQYVQAHGDIGFLVTELSLPGIDGFQLLRTFSQTINAGAPVLVASAFHGMRTSAITLRKELGIGDVVPTTTSPEALQLVIRRLLRHEVATAQVPAWSPARADEARRLRSLDRTGALRADAQLDQTLQAIVNQVAAELDVPIAAVSLVLEDRQWFKARTGTHLEDTPLDTSFCRHVVDAKSALNVPDARAHPTFAAHSLVRDKVVRGYAGAPLIGSDGEVWGALCVIHPDQPLELASAHVDKLVEMARVVAAAIEARTGTEALRTADPVRAGGGATSSRG